MRPLLTLRGLHVQFRQRGTIVRAIDGVNLDLFPNEIVALVGESGSGKTMTALSVGRLLPPTAEWTAESIAFDGREWTKLSEEELRKLRGTQIAYVFQDPAASLNPVLTIGEQLCESLTVHRGWTRLKAQAATVEALAAVQLADPSEKLAMYPHQLSGGMQQRVMLAMATLLQPRLLIADEPTTALDATVQAQILALLLQLRRQFGMAILLITHDLGNVAPIAGRIAVMTAGRIVETAPRDQLYRTPRHPHTIALLNAILHPGQGRLAVTPPLRRQNGLDK